MQLLSATQQFQHLVGQSQGEFLVLIFFAADLVRHGFDYRPLKRLVRVYRLAVADLKSSRGMCRNVEECNILCGSTGLAMC